MKNKKEISVKNSILNRESLYVKYNNLTDSELSRLLYNTQTEMSIYYDDLDKVDLLMKESNIIKEILKNRGQL